MKNHRAFRLELLLADSYSGSGSVYYYGSKTIADGREDLANIFAAHTPDVIHSNAEEASTSMRSCVPFPSFPLIIHHGQAACSGVSHDPLRHS